MATTMQLFANPLARRDAPFGPIQEAVFDDAGRAAARAEIASWPGYAPTPLLRLDGLAAELGLSAIYYKDESRRFGLGSFKALGGAYAVAKLLRGRRAAGLSTDVTVSSATDGNHGRSVAWGARTFGCGAAIFIHAGVSENRRAAIASYGAEVIRTEGDYDASVRECAAQSARTGWFVISDTSYDGYMDVPRDVMQGYAVLADEAIGQLDGPPTHAFLQGGVGGLAAAVCACFWRRWGDARPRFVVVEPERADCLYQSARAGRPARATGDLDTVMAGLACGEISPLAWQVLGPGADDFMTIPDDAAIAAMRRLAQDRVVGGESGVAGLAGLIVAARAGACGLGRETVAFVVGSEGDTDPGLYAELVGRAAAEVRGG
jgi:diaminopropionate ammonia-lyase